jgi:hypothetical protein
MTARPFNLKKMKWLNAVCKDCKISPTAFRVAYLLGDHFNSISGEAWPSHQRLASSLCIATKTIQRAARELEIHGWLEVRRSRGRRTTNRYRPHWPSGKVPVYEDRSDPNTGHLRPQTGDENVPQSYLPNLLRTSLSRGREKKSRFLDRGLYEQRIGQKFGPRAEEALVELNKNDPELLDILCRAEKDGQLTAADMHGLQLHLASLRSSETSQPKEKSNGTENQ